MRHPSNLFGILPALVIGFAPAPSSAAEAPGATAPATVPVQAKKTAPSAMDAYAVLKSAPTQPAPGCKVTKDRSGELRASLYSAETGACPIARVGTDVVTLDELAGALADAHMEDGSRASRHAKAKGGMDFKPTLERLVDVRLIAMDAREMGIPEEPDFKKAMEQHRDSALRTSLQKEAVAGVKPDPADEEKYFKPVVKEWLVRSVMFDREGDAKAFHEAVQKGAAFDVLAKAAAAEKKARGGEPGYVSPKEMVPELAKVAAGLPLNQLSPPVKVGTGFVIFRLEGERFPENVKARSEARAQALGEAQHRTVQAFHQALVKKHAVVDEGLLKKLDFEAGGVAGYEALMKDTRPLVQIQGEPPITVAELTREVSERFFHGIADPIKEHRVNPGKQEAFDRLVGSRLFVREAKERKLDQTEAFRRGMDDYQRALAFNGVLERAIIPGVKVTEKEVMALYEKRKKSLTSPAMYRLDGVGFTGAPAVQAALDKVKAGTELAWLRANAEGRLKPEEQKVVFSGALASANTMPPALVKALAGASVGELRQYSGEAGQHYLVKVVEFVPPGVRPYEDLREKLAREVESEKFGAAVRDYAAKLRKVQKVDVIITRIAG